MSEFNAKESKKNRRVDWLWTTILWGIIFFSVFSAAVQFLRPWFDR